MSSNADTEPLLGHLNEQQRRAVTSTRKQVVILAGPGSGKTRIIVNRVAYLLKCQEMDPKKIMVATFTNKAARELKERIASLVEPDVADQLILGTFHHILVHFLRRYGNWIQIKKFNIVDQEDATAIVRQLISKHPVDDERHGSTSGKKQLINTVTRCVSKAKAQNIPPSEFLQHFKKEIDPPYIQKIYTEYQDYLKHNSLLDFDDILVYGLQLFTRFPALARRIEHVLIDEFQDTNTIQFMIMAKIIEQSENVTVVGDPDQSIYGWRSADITNLKRFQENYSDVDMVFLEQNYRSTQSILRASLSVISQDHQRIVKGLWTENCEGAEVVLKECMTLSDQAEFVVQEMQRLKNHSRGMLNWSDFVVLYRMNRFSSSVEQYLRLAKIPYCIVGGIKFFDRKEIKDILAYLRLADNPEDFPSFSRVINVPPRKIGEKTLAQIVESAEKYQISVFEVCEQICAGVKGMARVSNGHLKPFVDTILHVRKMSAQKARVADMVDYIIKSIDYEVYLQKSFKGEFDERMAHISDLITYSNIAENDLRNRMELETQNSKTDEGSDGDGDLPRDVREDSILSTFLTELALQTNDDAISRKDGPKDCVTLMTLHSAKGLEFPVVFVIGVQDGVIPHNMSDDRAEERRLLYVGMTRAEGLLYLTYSKQHPYEFNQSCKWSPFVRELIKSSSVENAMKPNLIIDKDFRQCISSRKILPIEAWKDFSKVLKRPFNPDAPLLEADPEVRESTVVPGQRSHGNFWSHGGRYRNWNDDDSRNEENHDGDENSGAIHFAKHRGYSNFASSAQPLAPPRFSSAASLFAPGKLFTKKANNDGLTRASTYKVSEYEEPVSKSAAGSSIKNQSEDNKTPTNVLKQAQTVNTHTKTHSETKKSKQGVGSSDDGEYLPPGVHPHPSPIIKPKVTEPKQVIPDVSDNDSEYFSNQRPHAVQRKHGKTLGIKRRRPNK